MRDNAVIALCVLAIFSGLGAVLFGLMWAIERVTDNFGASIAFYVAERHGTLALAFAAIVVAAALIESWIRRTWP